jgi:hypothetical protein
MSEPPVSYLPARQDVRHLSPEDVEARVVSRSFFTAFDGAVQSGLNYKQRTDPGPLQSLVFCVLVLRNGQTVEASCDMGAMPYPDREEAQTIANGRALELAAPLVDTEARMLALAERLQAPKEAPPINSPEGQNVVALMAAKPREEQP